MRTGVQACRVRCSGRWRSLATSRRRLCGPTTCSWSPTSARRGPRRRCSGFTAPRPTLGPRPCARMCKPSWMRILPRAVLRSSPPWPPAASPWRRSPTGAGSKTASKTTCRTWRRSTCSGRGIASWRPAARWALVASTSTGFASPASPWAPRPRGTSDCASATTSRRWRRWLAAARGRVTAGRRRVRWRGSARCRFARIPWRPTTGVTPGVTSRGSRGTVASPGSQCKAPCPSRRTLDSGSSRKARTSLRIIVGASRLAAALALGPRVSLRAEARRPCSHRPQICS
mmetsp:Transcript_93124/g.251417  ORF Transcript_93124/g.251417 Transcript_93124/m.251417 type:complete len:286 (+) Transcript_93124:228-1085(+)